MALNISFNEAVAWGLGKIQEAFGDIVPDAERLSIIISRMEGEVDQLRDRYHEALRSEYEILDAEEDDGKLAEARTKREKRMAQGEKWGAECQTSNSKAEQARLTARLELCAQEVHVLDGEISSLEKQLATRRETTRIRKQRYEAGKADLKRLNAIGPTLLEQAKAMEDAERDRLQAVAQKGAGIGSAAGAILAELEAHRDKVQAGQSAAERIFEEADEDAIDLDAIDEQDAGNDHADALVAGWLAKKG